MIHLLNAILAFVLFFVALSALNPPIEPKLGEISNALIKKEKTIGLYKQNLNECYKRHGEKGCIRIEEKLLDLKADYNNYLIDCNQKLKELDTYRYRGKCEDMTKLYKKEK